MTFNFQENNPDSTSSYKTSKYNAAQAESFRLDILWQKFNNLIPKGKLMDGNFILDMIWGELVADATIPQPEKIKKGEKSTDDTTTFNNFQEELLQINKIKERNKLYTHIMKKLAFLRILQNKQGKGTAYEESVLDYMEEQ